jgi:transposase
MSQSIPTVERKSLSQLSKDELVEIILGQQKVIEQLHLEIEKLKISRDLDSTTSSKPPSTDLLKKPEKAKEQETDCEKQISKRKPGGQPGHQGKTRKGFLRIDRTEILQPSVCSQCGQREFLAQPLKVETQQVAQLVERPIEVVEYHRYHCQCNCCGAVSVAPWSPKIIPGQDLGVKLQAFLGWLGNYGHLPYEKQQEMLWELGKIEIGLGTIVKTNQRVEEAINPSVKQLSEWVSLKQPNIHVDETPWPVKGIKEWLWVFTNRDFCLFRAGDTRGRAELEAQLGNEYSGVLSSDDLNVYNGYPVFAQQKCLAHLRRHFERLIKLPSQNNQAIGQAFKDLIDEAFRHYHLWQQNHSGG